MKHGTAWSKRFLTKVSAIARAIDVWFRYEVLPPLRIKNQYFGDINDYKKYGLLRAIIDVTGFHVLVAWMLTPDDHSADGKFTSYLQRHQEYRHHDPDLFDGLIRLNARHRDRKVSLIERTDLLSGTDYFSVITSDRRSPRDEWFRLLIGRARFADFIFLDPDNGLEVKSRPYGRKLSSKFLYWHEVSALWSSEKSLMIYQHFIREKRTLFVPRMIRALRDMTPGSHVGAFSTANVVFLMALQPDHAQLHKFIVERVW